MLDENVESLHNTLRALYEMASSVDKADRNVVEVIEEEISKIDKDDYQAIKRLDDKYIKFFIQFKSRLLKKKYVKGKKVTDENYFLELKKLLALRNINADLELVDPENLFGDEIL